MIILEGIDGTGKSTVCEFLLELGYNVHHLRYDEKHEQGFLNFLKNDTTNLVLDRGFITELVYGPILRNHSKIDFNQTENIVKEYSKIGCKIIYLKALKCDLLKRRASDSEDLEMLEKYYEKLNDKYDVVIQLLKEYFEILTINTSEVNIDDTCNKIKNFLK